MGGTHYGRVPVLCVVLRMKEVDYTIYANIVYTQELIAFP